MPLVAAAILPHGFPLIPVLSDDADGAMATRQALEQVGDRFAAAGVEAIVLAGPHGIRVDGFMCVADVGRAAGTLILRDRSVEMNVPCDRQLIEAIGQACKVRDIPVAMAGFGGNRADQSVAPMDWGAMTPLWFTGHDRHVPGHGNVLAGAPADDSGPSTVLIVPSRSLPRQAMVDFGRALADVFARDDRKIGFIASCDWGHTHADDGPYGFHPKAAEVDARVLAAVRSNELLTLIDLPDRDVQDAAIDGLWQTLMLAGIQQVTPLGVEVLSYEVPAYYSMIVASYTAANS
jgi:aromatic ring-opening dioxygenase LigB subunit